MAHRETHKDKKLEDSFAGLGYAFSKILEATTSDTDFIFVSIHVKEIQRCLSRFRADLEERGEWSDAVQYFFELIEYPLQKLSEYGENRNGTKLNDKDAYIFASFVQGQVEHIKGIARELDDDYEASL